MSGGKVCTCKPQDRTKWRVRQYRCNYSAFNGGRRTPSDYSGLSCLVCGNYWRTKAAYVATIKWEQYE